jgi:hypothetical protein
MTADRLYAALLHLYPRAFREEYGDEMRAAFHELRHAQRQTPARFWTFIVRDTLTAVARERLDGARWLATAMFGLLATLVTAHTVTFTYRYFYHPYFEGVLLPVLPYGAALGLVLGVSVAAAQWMLFPARERRASHWLLASAVTLPVAILFCTAAIKQALDGLNPVVQIHHPIALDLLAIGFSSGSWNHIAAQFVAMAISASCVGVLMGSPRHVD